MTLNSTDRWLDSTLCKQKAWSSISGDPIVIESSSRVKRQLWLVHGTVRAPMR